MEFYMKKNISVLFLIFITMLMVACEETTAPEHKAVQMTKSELSETIGYTWFNGYWNYYQTNDSLTQIIDTTINRNIHKFVLFIEPECSCKELVKEPAYIVKVLDNSNINEDNYELWGMGSVDAEHPYENILNIKKLPFIGLMRNDDFVYSILDSFIKFKAYRNVSLEQVILESLEDNQ